MNGTEFFKEQTSKQPREYSHGQEEAGFTGDPAFTVEGQPAAGHDAMDVRMMG